MNNDRNSSIPVEVLKEVEDMFKQILAKLEPYHQPLTAAERREMVIIGDKTLAFVEKGKEYVDLYPGLVPGWLDKNDLNVDYEDMKNILPIKNLADQARETVYNIQCIAGSETYQWILGFYQGVKSASERNAQNAKIVSDEMGKRFQRRRKMVDNSGSSRS